MRANSAQTQNKNQKKQTKSTATTNYRSQSNIQSAQDQRRQSKQGSNQPLTSSNKHNQQKLDNKNLDFQNQDQEEVYNMIHEFLLKKGMQKTLQYFQDERQKNFKRQQNNIESEFINAFNNGQREAFFRKWNQMVPQNIRINDENTNKLEFYLQVYFLIYNIHPLFRRTDHLNKESINAFKQYLETRGSDLSKTSEFLQFYALPYMDKPQENQALSHLFTKEWVLSLKEKLQDYLQTVLQENTQPLLIQLYQQYLNNAQTMKNNSQVSQGNMNQVSQDESQIQSYVQQVENNNKELINCIKDQESRYQELKQDFQKYAESSKQQIMDSQNKWFKLAQDIANMAKDTIKRRLDQYESFLSQNVEELIAQSQDISIFDKGSTQDIELQYQDQSISRIQQQNLQQQQNQGVNNNNILANQLQQNQLGYNSNNYLVNVSNNQFNKNYNVLAQNFNNNDNEEQDKNNIINRQMLVQDQDQYVDQQNQEQEEVQEVGEELQQQQQFLQQEDDVQFDQDYQYVPIDFQAISQQIINMQNPLLSCAILQALRWRIIRTRGPYQRRQVVASYTTYDIIGCRKENYSLQASLLRKDQRVQEFALKLINAMASDFHGRSYLVGSDELMVDLIQILRGEQEDSSVRRNALGSLQKLSLRRKPQIIMIQNEMIAWIVNTLRYEKDTISEYSLEYATALFMNLSLRSLGKQYCEFYGQDVLGVILENLEHDNAQVRTFINGTLYSLLSKNSLREIAKSLGLHEQLEHSLQTSDERFIKQIQYIIDQLNNSEDENEQEALSDREDNDIDDIEDEDEINDEEETDEFIDQGQEGQQLFGEELLQNQFALRGQEAIDQNNLTRSVIEEVNNQRSNYNALNKTNNSNNQEVPFYRPTTPMMYPQNQQQQQQQQNQYQKKSKQSGQKRQQQQSSNQNQQSKNKQVPKQKNPEILKQKKPEEEIAFVAKHDLPRTPPDKPKEYQQDQQQKQRNEIFDSQVN